jgi:hypothetical protein
VDVDAEILVDEDVPHAGNIGPRNRPGQFIRGRQKMPNGLADHLEVPDDRVNCFFVGLELFEREALNLPFDPGDRIEDVFNAHPPFSRRHAPPRRGSDRGAAASAPRG